MSHWQDPNQESSCQELALTGAGESPHVCVLLHKQAKDAKQSRWAGFLSDSS
jgi:hypothetical protein